MDDWRKKNNSTKIKNLDRLGYSCEKNKNKHIRSFRIIFHNSVSEEKARAAKMAALLPSPLNITSLTTKYISRWNYKRCQSVTLMVSHTNTFSFNL